MVSRESLFLYKETRVNLEPPSPAAVVHIKLPVANGGRRLVPGNSKANGGDNLAAEERAFRVENLATASSIFHRKHHDSPRSFLWRVLDRGHVLSLRAVDVCKDQTAPDANLIVHIHFPKALRPGCVAFADPQNHDALCVFALDESLTLNYLLLRPDIFRKRSATEQGLGDAFRPHLSSSFGFKAPHRLVAVGADEFVVTLLDGGIIAFRREKSHDALSWKESLHNPVSFVQGLRNFLPFQNSMTVKYQGTTMEVTTAASAAVSSLGDLEAALLFTVCLDHRLRIWNLATGMIMATEDILGLRRDAHEIGKWQIDPSQANLVRILPYEEGSCLCVTYSPIGPGAFRFWKVTAREGGRIDVEPHLEPQQTLIPPPPSSADVWTLADFGVSHSERGGINLWILWKNNLIYRVTKLECSADNIDRAWVNDWVGVFADNALPVVPASVACDATDATEKWLQLIFLPGRFSRATIETALTMYERGLGHARDGPTRSSKGLAEAICSVLGSTASLERGSTGDIDYEQFRGTAEVQWRRFYRLVLELDKLRGEALSLAVDPDAGLAWVVCADSVSAIRDCNPLDRVYHNLSAPEAEHADVSILLRAGLTFRGSISENILPLAEAALRSEVFEQSSKTDGERMQVFSDKSGLWRQLSDEDCAQVVELLGPNFGSVDMPLYEKLLSLAELPEGAHGPDVRHPFTQFGQKLVIKGIQETAEMQRTLLFHQLILLVHMAFEFESEEDALHRKFDVGVVYGQLIRRLQRLELIQWLARSEFQVALSRSERLSFSGSPSSLRRGPEETQVITALEASVGHLLGLSDFGGSPLSTHITELITDICASQSSIELDPAMIQCMLLVRERPDLAHELGSFANQNPFSTYIQGRVFLALRDLETAAAHFRQASVGLSVPMRHANRHSAGLIDDSEWNLFYSGLANYYAHVVSLYDRHKAYSYVIDFARLSLQFVPSPDEAGTKSEMLSRLFTAASALSRFDVAHSALLSTPDAALRHAGLRRLVERMAERRETAALIALPFPGLRDAVDDILSQRCASASELETARAASGPLPGGGSPPWHQILYAWRIARDDHRGAAAVLLDRLRKLQRAGEGDKLLVGDDVLDTPVTRTYLMLINTLACVDAKQAWVCAEDAYAVRPAAAAAAPHGNGNGRPADSGVLPSVEDEDDGEDGDGDIPGDGKAVGDLDRLLLRQQQIAQQPEPWRKVVSLAEIRKQYQDELDRIAAIQNNQFAFAAVGEEDDDAMDES